MAEPTTAWRFIAKTQVIARLTSDCARGRRTWADVLRRCSLLGHEEPLLLHAPLQGPEAPVPAPGQELSLLQPCEAPHLVQVALEDLELAEEPWVHTEGIRFRWGS